MTVILVAGPPCAGKSTYVAQHRSEDDVVLDQDAMGVQAYNRAIAQLKRRKPSTRTWVIRCLGGQSTREQFAHHVGADDTVLLVPPLDELYSRARHRDHPARAIKAIDKWLYQEQRNTTSPRRRGRHPSERGYDHHHRQLRASLRPYVEAGMVQCWRCGMTIQPDAPWDLGHDDRDRSVYRGPEHRRCNRGSVASRVNRERAHRQSRDWFGQ